MAQIRRGDYENNGFLFWWTGSSLFVYPLALFVGALGLFGLGMFATIVRTPSTSGYQLMDILIFPYLGAFIGWSVGFLQKRLLRKYFYWTADHWITLSTVGGALGALAVGIGLGAWQSLADSISMDYYTFNSFGNLSYWAMPIFVGVISLVQWVSLRNAVAHAWVWVIGNVVGGIVFMGLATANPIVGYSGIDDIVRFVMIFVIPASQGFITGNVLLYLFEHYGYPVGELVPVRVRADEFNYRKPSVWDDAI